MKKYLVLGLLSFAMAAFAQSKTKKALLSGAKPKPAATTALKNTEERSGPAKLDARNSGGPATSFEIEKEAIADKKRDDQIEQAKKIIPRIEDGNPQKAEILFQLSELYWEKSRLLNRKEMLTFFAAQKEADEKRRQGEASLEPKEEHRESELYRSETTRLYETILREYPSYERKDEVLFNLAYNLYDTGQRDGAVKRYEELLKNYPISKFLADTYVQLGNHYFEVANVLDKARGYYEKAYASTNARIRSYALYKLAWCDFNAGAHEKALKKLQDTIDFAEKQGQEKYATDLKNEALNDSVRMYVELNRSDDAVAYFKVHAGKKKQAVLLARLGDALQGAGHHESAIKTYRALLEDNAMAEAAPDYQQAIVKSFEGLRQRDQVKIEVKKLAELYRPGSAWWTANQSKKEVLRSGFNAAEEALRVAVTEYHQEAQRTKQVDTYRLARDIYKQYVDAFASDKDDNFVSDQAFNMKFYYAEILWALEEWEAAAMQYREVVEFKIPQRAEAKEVANEKYRQQSAYNTILAYDKLVKIERGVLQRSDLKDSQKVEENKKKGRVEKTVKLQKRDAKELEEKPLTGPETNLVAACDRYNALFPKNSDEVDIAYQASLVLYDKNHFVEAARRFGEVIQKYPEEKRSQEAADLSMAVLEEKEEWSELNRLSRSFKSNSKLNKPGSEFAKRVSGIVEGSQYKYIDESVYKKEKNLPKASQLFQSFVEEFPKSANADRALTYSMIIAREAFQLDRSIALGERVLKEYPASVFDLKVRYLLAQDHEQLAAYEKAAQRYEAFVAAYDAATGTSAVDPAGKRKKEVPGRQVKSPIVGTLRLKDIADESVRKERETLLKDAEAWVPDAQFNAGLWYEGTGDYEKALSSYGRYLERFKDKGDIPEIVLKMAALLEKQGKPSEAVRQYESYVQQFSKDARVTDLQRLEVKQRILGLQIKMKNSAEEERVARDIGAASQKLKEGDRKNASVLHALAQARFTLLDPLYKGYVDLKLKRFATFKKDLAQKQKKLSELEGQYAEVLRLGNPEYGLAALTRIGLLYADFAQNITELADPPGLDDDQLSLFRAELENRYVFPVEEKASEAFEKALAKSYELALYNEWTLLSQDQLNKLKPGLYAKAPEMTFRESEALIEAPLEKTIRWPETVAAPAVTEVQ
jgi:cellulose synthase operon protein C